MARRCAWHRPFFLFSLYVGVWLLSLILMGPSLSCGGAGGLSREATSADGHMACGLRRAPYLCLQGGMMPYRSRFWGV